MVSSTACVASLFTLRPLTCLEFIIQYSIGITEFYFTFLYSCKASYHLLYIVANLNELTQLKKKEKGKLLLFTAVERTRRTNEECNKGWGE